MVRAAMQKIPAVLVRVGTFGLVIVAALNAYAYFAKAQPAALPFSEYWWVSWFPAYLVWLVFIVAGLRGRARRQSTDAS